MALKNPASDLVEYLHLRTVAGTVLTAGTNLFLGRGKSTDASPSPSVHVLNTGGQAPEPYISGTSREAYYRPTVQVMVRADVDCEEDGETFARGVMAELQQLALTGYVSVLCREAQPYPIGLDDGGRPMWSMNVEAQYKAGLP